MKRTLVLALGLVAMLVAAALSAQTPGGVPIIQLAAGNGEIRGTILVAGSNMPVPRASVTVRAKASKAIVAGAIAAENGSFRIEGLPPGTYYLRVSSIGFAPKTSAEFAISAAAPSVALGAIQLSQIAVALQSVQVATERATMTIEPDRNSYSVKQLAPTATNASEVLDAVPSVQVDGEGKVSYRGSENVVIQINGRSSPITGAQLGAYLKSLPASVLERIEVIPNPSAKYDPDGMAGIINIVLKQNTDLGLSGGFVVGGASYHRYNGSGTLGYQKGRLTLFNSVGFNVFGNTVNGVDNRERFAAMSNPQSFTYQTITNPLRNRWQSLTSSADFKLNERDIISNSLNFFHRSGDGGSEVAYSELDGTRALFDRYDRFRADAGRGFSLDNSLAFKRAFVPKKHELSGELRFFHGHGTDGTEIWRQPLTLSGATSSPQLEGENEATDSHPSQLTAQVDYVRPLAGRTRLEAGFKGLDRWLDRDFVVQNDAMGTGEWLRSDLSNTLSFDEKIQAVYGLLSSGISNFDLQVGLRGEYARRNFSFSKLSSSYKHSYGSLFPSGVISYNQSDATKITLSYSRRIRRPGIDELNPFPVYGTSLQNVLFGNPQLNAEYTDAIDGSISHNSDRGSIQLSPFYRHTSNAIRQIINLTDTVDGRAVTSLTYTNLASATRFGTDVNGALKLGKMFSGLASFSVFKFVSGGGSDPSTSSNTVTWGSRVNGTMQFTPATTLQANYYYRAPFAFEGGHFSANQQATFSVRHKLSAASTVSLRVADPFYTYDFKERLAGGDVTQYVYRTFETRAVYVTYQYSFGSLPTIRQPRQEPQEPQAAVPPPQ